MTTYRVLWAIDLEADTAQEAARMAREMQLDPEAQVGHFVVEWTFKQTVEVDLDATPKSRPKVPAHIEGNPTAKELEETYVDEVPNSSYSRRKWMQSAPLHPYWDWVAAAVKADNAQH